MATKSIYGVIILNRLRPCKETRKNEHYLGAEFTLHDALHVTADLGQALDQANVILFVVPTNAIPAVLPSRLDPFCRLIVVVVNSRLLFMQPKVGTRQ